MTMAKTQINIWQVFLNTVTMILCYNSLSQVTLNLVIRSLICHDCHILQCGLEAELLFKIIKLPQVYLVSQVCPCDGNIYVRV